MSGARRIATILLPCRTSLNFDVSLAPYNLYRINLERFTIQNTLKNSTKDKMDLRFLLSGSTLEKKEVKIVKKGSKAIGNFDVYPNYVLGFEFKQDADGFGRVISGTGHFYWDTDFI